VGLGGTFTCHLIHLCGILGQRDAVGEAAVLLCESMAALGAESYNYPYFYMELRIKLDISIISSQCLLCNIDLIWAHVRHAAMFPDTVSSPCDVQAPHLHLQITAPVPLMSSFQKSASVVAS
jgi:hypothetical protein